MIGALLAEGYRVRHLVAGASARALGGDRFEANLTSADQIAAVHGLFGPRDDAGVGCVISLLGLSEPFRRPGVDEKSLLDAALATFLLAKEFESDLLDSAAEGGGWFLSVTALGGRFGVENVDKGAMAAAGAVGVVKSLGRELPKLFVKNIDVDATLPPAVLASRLLEELPVDDGLVEVGLDAQGRWKLDLTDELPPRFAPNPLDDESVALITGGAYGVTAEIAKSLADSKCRLVLVGRSSLPAPEPAEQRNLDAAGLRKHFIEKAKSEGRKTTPAEIGRAIARIEKDRQILGTIEACQRRGAKVEYHALDVRDAAAVTALVEDIYRRFGRLDGVVHGAGVIEDKKIRDKSPDSFINVFSTKVNGATALARALRPDSLKFLVFFSSVSGRFGNAGQTDYSAANETLNKLASWLQARWPARVVSINWGPWDGGMVTDELRRLYATVGFKMIPLDEGVEAFHREVRRENRVSAEVVVSCSVAQMAGSGLAPH